MGPQAKSVALVHQFQQTLPKAIAMGSASETEYLILLARGLKYLNAGEYAELTDATIRVKKMLTSLLKKLRA